MEFDTIVCADFLEVAPAIADSSVNLIISDWPYFKVKNLDWDRQWKTVDDYLEWIGRVCAEYRRILAPNGSLYAFASPKPEMAWGVEGEIRKCFNIVNRITWRKGKFDTKAEMFPKHTLRSYFPASEIIFFTEHYGADSVAKGELGYGAKCDELRGFVFEPLRAYLDGERRRADIDKIAINVACGFSPTPGGMASRHYFSTSQWQLPTAEHYAAMQELFNQNDGHEYLQREYEDLRAEYEDLRRPFSLTARDQYTDVWDFPTVKAYPSKHPCEKPLAMYEHIIKVSSRPGDLVADFFCGSGTAAVAAMKLDRRYLCSDMMQHWVDFSRDRVERARSEMFQLELFNGG